VDGFVRTVDAIRLECRTGSVQNTGRHQLRTPGRLASESAIGGLYGASSRGQLRVDRFFLPQELRGDRLGSRLLKMAEEEGRRRRCTRVTLNTMEIQALGFYLKQGYEMAAKLDCDPPGVTR
jgi:GNAT superfamily N-acetyltransferase